MLHEKRSEEGEIIHKEVHTTEFYKDAKTVLKYAVLFFLAGLLLYGLWYVFSWWLLFFIPLLPIWAVLLYHFLTRDYIRVLEVKLPGDSRTAPSGEFKTISYSDDSALWYFPPERFKEYEKRGRALQLPSTEIYVVDRVDEENQVLYFPESVLSNLDYYTSAEAFLYLKKQLTSLMRQNILLRNFMSSYAQKIAAKLLSRFKIVDNVAEKANAPELMEPDEFEEMMNRMLRTTAAEKKKDPEGVMVDE